MTVVQSRATPDDPVPPAPAHRPLPEQVRHDAAAVAGRARFVRIDDGRLAELAARLAAAPDEAATTSPWDVVAAPGAPPEAVERAVATAVVLDTVNFGSGWHPVLRKSAGRSGATTVAAGVRRFLDAGGTHATRFADLSATDLAAICDQPADGEAMELMALFAAALRELAQLLLDEFDGRVLPLVEAADGSAAAFASRLAALPRYHDVSTHDGRPVALHKRAQIAAADVARAGGGAGPTAFGDLDRLTAFADNLVPHVLRVEGVLVVDPHVVARIDRGELLEHGSAEEVEIRAVGVHAVELLSAALARGGRIVPPRELDGLLWRRGAAPEMKAVPRHRTRCTAY